MESFPNPLDLIHTSIWEKTHRKIFGKRRPFQTINPRKVIRQTFCVDDQSGIIRSLQWWLSELTPAWGCWLVRGVTLDMWRAALSSPNGAGALLHTSTGCKMTHALLYNNKIRTLIHIVPFKRAKDTLHEADKKTNKLAAKSLCEQTFLQSRIHG